MRTGGEKGSRVGVLVGCVFIDDEMQVESGRNALIDVPQERKEPLMAAPSLALGFDLATLCVERGKQCSRAVAQAVMGDASPV